MLLLDVTTVDATVMDVIDVIDGAALTVWVHGSSRTLVLSGMMLYPS